MNINVEIAETSVPDGLLRILSQLPKIEELTDSEVTITLTFKAS